MLKQQLGFGIGSMKPTTIFGDNKGAITIGLHPTIPPPDKLIKKTLL